MLQAHRLGLLVSSLVALAACSGTSSPPSGEEPKSDGGAGGDAETPTVVRSNEAREAPVAADEPVAVDANNAFAVALYRESLSQANGGNWLTSPLSAHLALTMAYAGAQGETATQMASVLHVPTSGPSIFDAENALSQDLNGRAAAAYKAAMQRAEGPGSTAPSESDYALDVVNSIWGETGWSWASPFLSTMAKDYGTGIYPTDFADDPTGATNQINQWVSEETAGKINPLLPPTALDDLTRMVLVNAIHVKLPWAEPFQTSQTALGAFTRGDDSVVQVEMMQQTFEETATVGYAETTQAQLVSLPLANGSLSVVFALPKTNLADLDASLTATSFANIQQSGYTTTTVILPKLSITTNTFSLAGSLQSLGMTDAFSKANADFRGLIDPIPGGGNLYLQDVLQKATLDVAENGVEAAAATAVIVGETAGVAGQVTSVTVDFNSPFLVAIVDQSGAVLFLGQIEDPSAT